MDQEIKTLLEQAGWNPQDDFVSIKHFLNFAHCGDPTDVGDADYEMMMVAKTLVRQGAVFCVDAVGDSMTGNGINEGDTLMVRLQSTACNDDVVIAIIEGQEVTVKNYVETDDGEVWLVPSNENYSPLRMSDFPEAKIIGVVTKVTHNTPRASHRDNMARIREARKMRSREGNITTARLRRALLIIAPEITVNRHWYSVYRVLVDCGLVKEDDFTGFSSLLEEALGNDTPELNIKDLRALAVNSFAKPVDLWNENNAPVSGARFFAYQNIARAFRKALM